MMPSSSPRGQGVRIVVLAAEVGLDDGGVVLNLRWFAEGDQDAMIEDRDAARDTHHQRHIVLDQDQCDAEVAYLANDAHQLQLFGRIYDRRGHVEKDKSRYVDPV